MNNIFDWIEKIGTEMIHKNIETKCDWTNGDFDLFFFKNTWIEMKWTLPKRKQQQQTHYNFTVLIVLIIFA